MSETYGEARRAQAAAELNRRIKREERLHRTRQRLAIASGVIGILLVAVIALTVAGFAGLLGGAEARGSATDAPQRVVATVASQSATSVPPKIAVKVLPRSGKDSPVSSAVEASAFSSRPTPKLKPMPKLGLRPTPKPALTPMPTTQHFTVELGGSGYVPSLIRASSATPITLTVGKGEGCATGFAVPKLGILKNNSKGPVTFSLGRLKPGTYAYSCEMGMVTGRLVVR